MLFTCSKCDAQLPKWSGRCSECQAWGTIEKAAGNGQKTAFKSDSKIISLDEIDNLRLERLKTKVKEFDEFLGGGLVEGSLLLIGGEPGIGKSTVALQLLGKFGQDSLYISGEESAQQIKLRAQRIGESNLKILNTNSLEDILYHLQTSKPKIAIIDSIQTIYSSQIEGEAGNIAQIKTIAVKLLELAKKQNIALIIIGHITKDGSIAGPKTLEHLVDAVFYLEGEKNSDLRILRSIKNRFGSTNELIIFEMTEAGLQIVSNPSKLFLSPTPLDVAGTVTGAVIEGSRCFLVEVQALINQTVFGYPQRKSSGYDLNRFQLLLAVLGKRANLNFNTQDAHLNVTGGFKIKEPALDLAVAMACASALTNKTLGPKTLVFGEVGLAGEIRAVKQAEKRLKEGEKLGFEAAIVPFGVKYTGNMKISQIKTISEAIQLL
ncbi:MAG TPA: DNA repair protein RadA [Candidatus Bipolaricaulota bacterium]|nr:DNA repair protein RadA [Candidatus Bipolaricaulota bacterium]